jgi:hypothetical protein
MKRFLIAGVAGLCLILPSVSPASTISFEVSGSDGTLLFDPSGCTPSQLPYGGYYRSYNCRIGEVPTPVVILTQPPKDTTIPNNPEPKNNNPNPPQNPPGNNDPTLPPNPAPCVPAPASAAMSGLGLVATAIVARIRSRRRAAE